MTVGCWVTGCLLPPLPTAECFVHCVRPAVLHSRVFDREGHGFITVPDLQEVLQKLGEKLSTEECQVKSIPVYLSDLKWF